ncbi:TadE/TadG family type IV pilus assembly protein [Bosea sp. (in: a-proteobacteria)]|uniref:TadE/TadG family type IV pilus assembly protein n=1 Tax=Bosea sp. (in: a-proteobacteria) TaxID=1871050 RepID=UPI00263520ED|nr:TadE/TadG family type IV pilus assembly protein [Bosea sp. (in: a-proteobacteria)]MCO5090257.1 pilus assembly protein [Bosea sp. (in: a-proteobacteria)]
MFDRAKNLSSSVRAALRLGRGGRLLRRFRRSQDGVVVVEFAFVAVPFFALLFAIFETALMFWTNQVLEESLSQASRSLVTGQSQYRYTAANPAANATKFRDDVCAKAPMGLIDCAKLSVDVRTYASFAEAKTQTSGSNPVSGGTLDTNSFTYVQPQRNDIVVVRAVLDYKLFLTSWASAALANIGSGRRAIVASTAFRAEPFTP